jgi:hypothetical protein
VKATEHSFVCKKKLSSLQPICQYLLSRSIIKTDASIEEFAGRGDGSLHSRRRRWRPFDALKLGCGSCGTIDCARK